MTDPALAQVLADMHATYAAGRVQAVRSQAFIKLLHGHVATQLTAKLHPDAVRRGVYVKEEAKILGSHKAKDVDVAVIDPTSGPLLVVGVRSQMSSVGKNVLTYYQDIVGEAVSLQERYPMAVYGYAYLHPLVAHEGDGKATTTDYARYAKLYASITGRDDVMYKQLRGIYDEFAYVLVDFDKDPIELRDDLVAGVVESADLKMTTFVDRLVERVKRRTVWLDLFA